MTGITSPNPSLVRRGTIIMDQCKKQSAVGFPLFERPSEAVVFWVLENLCRSAGGKCKITFADLARRCSLAQSTVKRAVHRLAKQKVIQFWPGCNQYQGSVYEIVCGNHEMLKQKQMLKHDSHAASRGVQHDRGRSAGVDVSQSRSAGPKIGQPNLRDISCITNDLYIGDKHDRRAVHNQHKDSAHGLHRAGTIMEPTDGERLAFQVADGLGDVKNLRLYESYCKRYPTEIILTAYVRAREVSPDKIKKSRGALFNFLVQKYGGKNKNNRSHSGFAAGTAGDGRGCAGSR